MNEMNEMNEMKRNEAKTKRNHVFDIMILKMKNEK